MSSVSPSETQSTALISIMESIILIVILLSRINESHLIADTTEDQIRQLRWLQLRNSSQNTGWIFTDSRYQQICSNVAFADKMGSINILDISGYRSLSQQATSSARDRLDPTEMSLSSYCTDMWNRLSSLQAPSRDDGRNWSWEDALWSNAVIVSALKQSSDGNICKCRDSLFAS